MIDVEEHGAVAVVRFARPPANAFELEFIRALEGEFTRLENEPSVRAVVLVGSAAFFSGGVDLKVIPTAPV